MREHQTVRAEAHIVKYLVMVMESEERLRTSPRIERTKEMRVLNAVWVPWLGEKRDIGGKTGEV